MSKPFRIFLCSTFTDLSNERNRVLDAIRALQLQHDSMEFFGARSTLAIQTCLEEVRQSDVLVVVLGARYGNLVPRRQISFSEAEYREAYRLGKPCLVYLRDENVPVIPKHIERDAQKLRALERWKSTLTKRHTVFNFTQADSLALQVTADLSRTVAALRESEKNGGNRSHAADVSSAIARAEQIRQATDDMQRAYDIALEILVDVLQLAGKENIGHCKRVTAFTIAIARAMGVSKENIRTIARAAFLHDIGKLAVPDQVLRKPTSLTPEEERTMRAHCFKGYLLLKRIPFLSESADIVYSHHEKYDGNGYPRQLRGESIPIGARILAIAETLEAITTGTSYHGTKSVREALKDIAQQSGKSFDPTVILTFLRIPVAVWEELRGEIGDSDEF